MGLTSEGIASPPRGSDPHLPPGLYTTGDFPIMSADGRVRQAGLTVQRPHLGEQQSGRGMPCRRHLRVRGSQEARGQRGGLRWT